MCAASSEDSSEPLHLEIEVLPTHKHAKEVCMFVCKCSPLLTDTEITHEKCHPQEGERKRAQASAHRLMLIVSALIVICKLIAGCQCVRMAMR